MYTERGVSYLSCCWADVIDEFKEGLPLHFLFPDKLGLVQKVETEGAEVQLTHEQRLPLGHGHIPEAREWLGVVLSSRGVVQIWSCELPVPCALPRARTRRLAGRGRTSACKWIRWRRNGGRMSAGEGESANEREVRLRGKRKNGGKASRSGDVPAAAGTLAAELVDVVVVPVLFALVAPPMAEP